MTLKETHDPDLLLQANRDLLQERDALKEENERLKEKIEGTIADNPGHPFWQTANRKELLDLARFQCGTTKACMEETKELYKENERLKKLISTHNEGINEACCWMQNNRGCLDYTARGEFCPDCPRDWAIDAAREDDE
jgi:hypothetical protein